MSEEHRISTQDKQSLREVAKKYEEIANLPIMQERVRDWKALNGLKPNRPMMLILPEGSWRELLKDGDFKCEGAYARGIEWELRHRIYKYENMDSDNVVPGEFFVHKCVFDTGWGLQAEHTASSQDGGAWGFKPVIESVSDLDKIKMPEVVYDEEQTLHHLELARELFDGILPVRLKGVSHISFHLMNLYTSWRGLEQVMYDMCLEPDWLHDAMQRMQKGYQGILDQYQQMNVLDTNNDNTWLGSGAIGYTEELPAEGFDPAHVRLCDMWGSAEAQEMAQVSPEMHEEFILQYERPLLEPFGLTHYGCCEDLTKKLPDLLKIPNMRRLSISPWADVEQCAEQMGSGYVMNWKPNPAMLVGSFDADAIRKYISDAVSKAAKYNTPFEMVLKDTHTVENHPERFTQWAKIAREVIRDYS